MSRIVTAVTFALACSISAAQMGGVITPENLSCSETEGLKQCTQNFIEAFLRTGLLRKTRGWQSGAAIFSPPELLPEEIEQLCQIYMEADDCFNQAGIRPQCNSHIVVKSLDNVLGYMCSPDNKKVLLDGLSCVQNLMKTDPRLQNCVAEVIEEIGLYAENGQSQSIIAKMSNILANVCPILNSTFECTRPVIVPNCGQEIFDLSTKLAENALEILSIDCTTDHNPFSNATKTSEYFQELIDGVEPLSPFMKMCPAANECLMRFSDRANLSALVSLDPGSLMPATSKEQFLELCGMSEQLFSCFEANDVFRKCENDSTFNMFMQAAHITCQDPHRQVIADNIECLSDVANHDPIVHQCLYQLKNNPNIYAKVDDTPESYFATLCRSINEAYECSREPLIARCGYEIYDTLVNISAALLEPLSPACIFPPRGMVPEIVAPPSIPIPPPSPPTICEDVASICMQEFVEAQNNISIPTDSSPFTIVPNITREQYLKTCEQTVRLQECFAERNVWAFCVNDSRVDYLNRTVFLICDENYRPLFEEKFDCVARLQNKDPTIRDCINNFTTSMYEQPETNISLSEYFERRCSAVNDVYVCTKSKLISECGAEMYSAILRISEPSLQTVSPNCTFSEEVQMITEEKTTLEPDIKKTTPADGEMASEAAVSDKKEQNGANGVVGSFIMLMITAALVFW